MYIYHLDSFPSLCSVLYVLCLCIPSMGPKLEIKHLLTYLLTYCCRPAYPRSLNGTIEMYNMANLASDFVYCEAISV